MVTEEAEVAEAVEAETVAQEVAGTPAEVVQPYRSWSDSTPPSSASPKLSLEIEKKLT